jgi:hypothetical protein
MRFSRAFRTGFKGSATFTATPTTLTIFDADLHVVDTYTKR